MSKFLHPYNGGEINYVYDILDRLTSCTDTEGYTFSFSYDANGNTIGRTDGRGKRIDEIPRIVLRWDCRQVFVKLAVLLDMDITTAQQNDRTIIILTIFY